MWKPNFHHSYLANRFLTNLAVLQLTRWFQLTTRWLLVGGIVLIGESLQKHRRKGVRWKLLIWFPLIFFCFLPVKHWLFLACFCSNFWMIIRNASLWEQTMWAPSRCSRSACLFVGKLWCWWARTQWCARLSEGIWKTTQLWRSQLIPLGIFVLTSQCPFHFSFRRMGWNVTVLCKLIFADCCLISGGMWALCSPRRTSLRSGTCCWPTR